MSPITFPKVNVVFAKDQPEYQPLPAFVQGNKVICCWQLSWMERFKLLFSGKFYIGTLTFGSPLQPILPDLSLEHLEKL